MTVRWPLALDIGLRRLGALRLAGLMLGLTAVAIHGYLTKPLHEDIIHSTDHVRQLSAQLSNGEPALATPHRHLEAFEAVKLPRERLSEAIESLFAIAGEHQLELARGDYRLEQSRQGGFQTYRISVPVTGAYPALRSFVEALLATWPGMAVEQLSFSRGQASSSTVEAVLDLSLLVES